MKCPNCGAETKQRQRGEIVQKQTAVKLPPLILWHCGNCAFLYTTQPPLTDNIYAGRTAKIQLTCVAQTQGTKTAAVS